MFEKPITAALPVLLAALLAACGTQKGGNAQHEEAEASSHMPGEAVAAAAAPEASESAAAKCGADRLGSYLNLLPTETAKESIARAVDDRPIRYIEPGDAVTHDLRPDRLNVEIGVDGRIKRFHCG